MAQTGARVIGSNESARVLREAGVRGSQLMPSQGGERYELRPGVSVKVIPSLHSCIWVGGSSDPGKVVLGDYGLCEHEKMEVRADRGAGTGEQTLDSEPDALQQMQDHCASTIGSDRDGGALAYLFETQYGSIFWQDTSGYWTGLLHDVRPDFAIVAMAGRGNVDGDPIQGSLAQYVGRITNLLRPSRLTLGHHDDWMPPMTHDMTSDDALTPVRNELSRVTPYSQLVELSYLSGYRIFE